MDDATADTLFADIQQALVKHALPGGASVQMQIGHAADDSGAMVPLWLAHRHGDHGPTVLPRLEDWALTAAPREQDEAWSRVSWSGYRTAEWLSACGRRDNIPCEHADRELPRGFQDEHRRR